MLTGCPAWFVVFIMPTCCASVKSALLCFARLALPIQVFRGSWLCGGSSEAERKSTQKLGNDLAQVSRTCWNRSLGESWRCFCLSRSKSIRDRIFGKAPGRCKGNQRGHPILRFCHALGLGGEVPGKEKIWACSSTMIAVCVFIQLDGYDPGWSPYRNRWNMQISPQCHQHGRTKKHLDWHQKCADTPALQRATRFNQAVLALASARRRLSMLKRLNCRLRQFLSQASLHFWSHGNP